MRGGLNYSLPADVISDLEMSGCANVFFEDGLVKKRYGYIQKGINLPLTGILTGFDQFYLFTGSSSLLALTTKQAYKWRNTPKVWDTIQESEVEDNCETTWTSDMGANGSVADEGVIYKVGSKSQKITVNTAFTTGLIAHRDQSLGDKSAYSFVRLWIRADTDVAAGSLQFCIDDTAGCGSPAEEIDLPVLTKDTWTIAIVEVSDTSNLESIESLGLKVATDLSTSANVIIYIDDIQFVKRFSSDVLYTADGTDFWSTDYVRKSTETDPWLIMTNGVDPIKKYLGSGDMSNLISDYPDGLTALLAKQVIEFKDYLLLLSTVEQGKAYPQRVRWSDTADPEDFLNGNASNQDLPGADWIVGAIKFKGDYLVVLKERSVWLGHATLESDIFQFDQKVVGTGCAAGKTIESLGDEIIFLGWDDVYIFNGVDYVSVGSKIQRELFRSMNPKQIAKSFGVIIEEQKEYWLVVVSATEDYPDTAWCFNYELNKWSKHTFSDFLTMYGYYEKQAGLTIGDLVGTIGEQTWRIGERTTVEAMPTTLFGDVEGNVFEYDRTTNNDDGVAIDSWLSTKDFNPTQLQQRFIVLRLDVFWTGNSLTLDYSTDKGVTWTNITTFAANSNLEVPKTAYCRFSSNMVRLRFRNNTLGEHFEFSRMNVHWQLSGLRL